MYDYKEEIEKFIKGNFEPTYPDLANVKYTTEEFLGFLFQVFPVGCISDYELNEILISLDYERFTYSVENITVDKHGNVDISHFLAFGWCLHSDKIPMPK